MRFPRLRLLLHDTHLRSTVVHLTHRKGMVCAHIFYSFDSPLTILRSIPAAIVNFDYQNLRKYGRVERVAIGARMQNITPTLAAGLGLARSSGAIVSDMESGGAAEAAGLQIDDIVLAIDNRPIPTLPDLMAVLYLHPADKILKIDVLRGVSRMSFNLSVKVYHENVDELSDIPDLQKSLIRKLSIFVTDLDERVRP